MKNKRKKTIHSTHKVYSIINYYFYLEKRHLNYLLDMNIYSDAEIERYIKYENWSKYDKVFYGIKEIDIPIEDVKLFFNFDYSTYHFDYEFFYEKEALKKKKELEDKHPNKYYTICSSNRRFDFNNESELVLFKRKLFLNEDIL
jgi:hypothetical protein